MGYSLLSDNQAKMSLSLEFGYYSTVLQLQPAYKYRGSNTCPWAGQCKAYCLQHTGHNRFDVSEAARIRRTKLFYDRPKEFMALLCNDIESAQRKADRLGKHLSVRLNGLSDLKWEEIQCWPEIQCTGFQNIFDRFPNVDFVDYTKSIDRAFESLESHWPENYTLVYSVNEKSDLNAVAELLYHYGRASVVFDIAKGEPLPKRYKIADQSFRVIDGDKNDLRHLDPEGCVIGLRYKQAFSTKTGKALKAKKGFIILGDN